MGPVVAAAHFQTSWPLPVATYAGGTACDVRGFARPGDGPLRPGRGRRLRRSLCRLGAKLRAFLTRLTGAPSVADDLLQETFMRVHRARGGFEKGAAVVPWAYAIARNAWLDYVRSTRCARRSRSTAATTRPTLPIQSRGRRPIPSKPAIARETAALVESVLARLPSAQREAFVLLRYEGMSVQDAAEVLGIDAHRGEASRFRAYEALREALGRARAGEEGSHGA